MEAYILPLGQLTPRFDFPMCAGMGFLGDLHWEDFARLPGMELATTCHHLPPLALTHLSPYAISGIQWEGSPRKWG